MPPKNRSSDRHVAREMNLRWIPALVLLAIFTLAGMLIVEKRVQSLESSAAMINDVGRQRMLSQRAGLLARRLQDLPVAPGAQDSASRAKALRNELQVIGKRMERTHSDLVAGHPLVESAEDLPTALVAIFRKPPHMLDERCRAFVAAISSLAGDRPLDREALALVVDTAEDASFLNALDRVVNELQGNSERDLARLEAALVGVEVLTLGVLAALGLTVFRPMVANTRRHLRRLRDQADALRLTFDSALTGIAVVNPQGRLVAANRVLCELTGHRRRELTGTAWLDLIHPSSAAEAEELLTSALAGEEDSEARPIRLRTRAGEIRAGLIRCGAQRDEDDKPVRVVVHFEDTTERLKAQEDARQSRERLAHISRVTAMGEMAGGIAHEVNQPLTAIAAYAQACRRLAAAGKLDSEALDTTLDKISAQARRAGEVIRRLRNFVRRHDAGAEVVDVNAMIAEAVGLAEPEARLHDCVIETQLDANLPPVVADPVQLQQVVLNLIRNGVEAQAGTDGLGRVSIATAPIGREAIEVTVSDRGEGLPDVSEKLFEPFFTTKSSGMGLGLSISRTIIASHGGRLSCRPNSEGGATFCFTLPAAVDGRRLMAG